MKKLAHVLAPLLAVSLTLFTGCGDSDDPGDNDDTEEEGEEENEEEVITTLTLTFTPEDGGEEVVVEFNDEDGDGPDEPTIDDITLAADTTYSVEVEFTNGLENPPEDITEEVADEAEEHQVFIFGESVTGPASDVDEEDALVMHSYADSESDYGPNAEGDDLAVGLVNTVTTVDTGNGGEFTVVLRHLPPESGEAVKEEDLADDVASDGINSIAGDTDVEATFVLNVE